MKSFYPGAGSTGIFFERILSWLRITLIILITRIFTFGFFLDFLDFLKIIIKGDKADTSAAISLNPL